MVLPRGSGFLPYALKNVSRAVYVSSCIASGVVPVLFEATYVCSPLLYHTIGTPIVTTVPADLSFLRSGGK
jgi:hypothetical protein